MEPRRDYRSPEAAAYRALYKTARWAKARAAQLSKQPICEPCSDVGKVTPATVVNHRIPHRGDLALFWTASNHQSVCKPHHDGPIQRDEGRGYGGGVDAGGWPTDPKHPSNGGMR